MLKCLLLTNYESRVVEVKCLQTFPPFLIHISSVLVREGVVRYQSSVCRDHIFESVVAGHIVVDGTLLDSPPHPYIFGSIKAALGVRLHLL